MRTRASLLIGLQLALLWGCGDSSRGGLEKAFLPPGHRSPVEIDESDATYGTQIVTVRGVVAPTPQRSWTGKGATHQVKAVEFAAWRSEGGDFVDRKLTMIRAIPLGDEGATFPAYSILSFRVLLSTDRTRAILLEETSPGAEDESLLAAQRALQRPVEVSITGPGKLVLDRELEVFETKTNWGAIPVRLSFPVEEPKLDEAARQTAERLWTDPADWKRRIEHHAFEKLNRIWLAEGETPRSEAEFVSKLKLQAIDIEPSGRFEFWFDDGGLFEGHAIVVSGTVEEGPTDANLAG